AGIPTIVYGFFALVTVGPFLAGLGDTVGLDVSATSALTAGIVMGIMIIPFISSLSDDIIRQVPRAMRDGSLGLGATKSETIRMVIVPAALPGIVGAVLLAVSRAIGETMIVVLAAGNAPILRFNPAEPTSTFTVTIVTALTGDSDFAAPQSLVAFALGLTLFAITLVLNIGALMIVRRYREQYE
ncbi:MAG: ABC transporter permease subunit, partial [Rhodobacteraceae bacterium]|nr:ABC transporter permease subunit [Paracoccaceae bacterium]